MAVMYFIKFDLEVPCNGNEGVCEKSITAAQISQLQLYLLYV